MAAPTTQAEALALTSSEFQKGARRIVARMANKKDVKCCGCRAKVTGGEMYFDKGLRASTLNEKFYARKGLIWYPHCAKCAAK